jgi:hypothetical protein
MQFVGHFGLARAPVMEPEPMHQSSRGDGQLPVFQGFDLNNRC